MVLLRPMIEGSQCLGRIRPPIEIIWWISFPWPWRTTVSVISVLRVFSSSILPVSRASWSWEPIACSEVTAVLVYNVIYMYIRVHITIVQKVITANWMGYAPAQHDQNMRTCVCNTYKLQTLGIKKICRGYTWFRGELLHIDFVQLFFLLGIPAYKYVIGLCQCPHVSSLIVYLTASKCRYAKLRWSLVPRPIIQLTTIRDLGI